MSNHQEAPSFDEVEAIEFEQAGQWVYPHLDEGLGYEAAPSPEFVPAFQFDPSAQVVMTAQFHNASLVEAAEIFEAF